VFVSNTVLAFSKDAPPYGPLFTIAAAIVRQLLTVS